MLLEVLVPALISFNDTHFCFCLWNQLQILQIVKCYLKLIYLSRRLLWKGWMPRLWCALQHFLIPKNIHPMQSNISMTHREKWRSHPLPLLSAFILFTVDVFLLCPRKQLLEGWFLCGCRKKRWETLFIGLSLRENHWHTQRILENIWFLQEQSQTQFNFQWRAYEMSQ